MGCEGGEETGALFVDCVCACSSVFARVSVPKSSIMNSKLFTVSVVATVRVFAFVIQMEFHCAAIH